MTLLRALAFFGIAVALVGGIALYQQGGYSLDVGRFFACEGDECGEPSSGPPRIEVFEPDRTTVAVGEAVRVTWRAVDADECHPLAGAGFETGGRTEGNNTPFPLAGSGGYAIECSGPGGSADRNFFVETTGGSDDDDDPEPTPTPEDTPTPPEDTPTPPPSDTCEIPPTDEGCADGDCDGDEYPNPAGPAAFADSACNDPDDGNRCTRGSRSITECVGGSDATPTPESTPPPDTCQVNFTDADCADGDCDGDTDPNPAGSTAFANPACNDPDDGNRCTRAQLSGSQCTGGADTTPAPTPTPEQGTPTPAPDTCQVNFTDADCADGDCDGDTDPNPAGPTALSNPACNDPNDGNRCVRAQFSRNSPQCTGGADTPTPAPATPTPGAPTPAPTPTPTPTPAGQSTCFAAGGSVCSQQPTCPTGSEPIGQTTDCAICCRSTSATPTPSTCAVAPTDASCADGDCDGDGALNPAAPSANPVQGCNDQNDGDRCVGAFLAPAQCGAQPSATPPLPVANHLECRSNTCVVVSGEGGNSCGPEGAACGNQPPSQTLVEQIRSRFGVRVEGSYSTGELEAIISNLGRFDRGNLNTIQSNNCSGDCGGALACMCNNGRMTLRPGGNISDQIIGHELFHAVQFSNGGVMSRSRSLFSSAGGNFAVFDGARPFVGGLGGAELMAYVVQTNIIDSGGNRARVQDFLSRGITGPRDQYNFATEFRGVGGDPVADAALRAHRFALLGKAFSAVTHVHSAHAGEEPVVFDDGHSVEVPGPALQILSPADGTPVTVAAVTVSGKALANAISNSPIARVQVTFNGAVVADAVLSSAQCGTQQCVNWSTMLTLRPGANTVQVGAVDEAGETSEDSPAIVVNFVAAVVATTPVPTAGLPFGGAGTVPTGPGRTAVVALAFAAAASLLYAGYTRTGSFRRHEVEKFAQQGRDIDLRS